MKMGYIPRYTHTKAPMSGYSLRQMLSTTLQRWLTRAKPTGRTTTVLKQLSQNLSQTLIRQDGLIIVHRLRGRGTLLKELTQLSELEDQLFPSTSTISSRTTWSMPRRMTLPGRNLCLHRRILRTLLDGTS